MAELPRVRALLGELLQLAPEDEQLPLPIILNLHRAQLQTPLVRVAALAENETRLIEGAKASIRGIEWELDFWYPSLEAGKLFTPNTDVIRLRGLLRAEDVSLQRETLKLHATVGHANPDNEVIMQLLTRAAASEPEGYDALVQLYRSTLPGSRLETRMQLLEVELGLSDEVGRMVLDFGLDRSPG
jgi:hypothetical protein